MSEMDCTDLVRALNEQAELPVRKPRPQPAPGYAGVKDSDVIAGDNCWCGRPNGHDWTGKQDGAPHPRYP